jgi:hypothetical protein
VIVLMMWHPLGHVAWVWGSALGSFDKNMTKVDVLQSQSLNIATIACEMVTSNEDARALIKIKMEVGFLRKR